MSILWTDVLEQALRLPAHERIRLAQQLWDSVPNELIFANSNFAAIIELAKKRDAELNDGALWLSHAEVMKAARQAVQSKT